MLVCLKTPPSNISLKYGASGIKKALYKIAPYCCELPYNK